MLPIYDAKSEILDHLARINRLVLTAPTGSGKTTQVPQILLRDAPITGQNRLAAWPPAWSPTASPPNSIPPSANSSATRPATTAGSATTRASASSPRDSSSASSNPTRA